MGNHDLRSYDFKRGERTAIWNTLLYLEEHGYIASDAFWKLKEEIEIQEEVTDIE